MPFRLAAVLVLAVLGLLVPQHAVATAAAPPPRLGTCGAGEFCVWEDAEFRDRRLSHELSDTPIESCVALPPGFSADSLANRTGRPVTAYQSVECAETGEFHTHPSGSYTPELAYQVRAFKVWER